VRDARSVIRNRLLPRFGERRLEDITEREVERWARRLGADRPLSNATKRKVIVIFHGVMARACRVYRLPVNPIATVEKPRLAAPGAIEVSSPEEVHALVRAAASEQNAAIFPPAHSRPAPGRARRIAVARGRLRRLVHPRTEQLCVAPGCGRCVFTICATPSARG
jgi:hypothetical protein